MIDHRYEAPMNRYIMRLVFRYGVLDMGDSRLWVLRAEEQY